MKIIRYNLIVTIVLFLPFMLGAQTQKLDKTYKTSDDVVVKIEASHTNITVVYWDKDQVEIQAGLESDKKENTKELLANWKLETSGNNAEVEITSGNARQWSAELDLSGLEKPLASLPQMLEPLLNNLVTPLLESMSTPLPPEFRENMGKIKFDYEAYKKDGDKYMEKFEKEMEANFGAEFEKDMEKWASQFEKNAEKWEKDFEIEMEVNGEQFEKVMEKWGESFGKDMEAWGESFGKQMEAHFAGSSEDGNKVVAFNNARARKNLHIKMPRNGRLVLDVRHGSVNLPGNTKNLKATLSHSKLTAETISGKNTRVEAAYTPVTINYWTYGVMEAKYVKHFKIEKVKSIKLISNSSDVRIEELEDTGILSGNFGELAISRLGTNFKTLDIDLENSELQLKLPSSAFNLMYNGTQSKIRHPSSLKLTARETYDNKKLDGYYKSKDAGGNINIKANFSEVLLN